MEKIRVGDLRRFLESKGCSPETFAKEVKLSHMTIRRWLAQDDAKALPPKYFVTLAPHLGLAPASPAFAEDLASGKAAAAFSATNVAGMVGDLEKSGQECEDAGAVKHDVEKKLKKERFDRVFVEHCKFLTRAIFSKDTSKKSKAIAVGALVYFLNPIDLIPDHIPVIGYMDDLAVLSLAVNTLSKEATKQKNVRSRDELRSKKDA